MKVFAVVKEDGVVKLLTWPSKKAFQATESWLDERFIRLLLSEGLAEHYAEPHEQWVVIDSPDEIETHHLLHAEYLKR